MSAGLLDEGFRTALALRVRYSDGRSAPLAVARWHGRARGADSGLLARADGPTLDVGCGPGRLAAALVHAGIPALGIDTAPTAVRLTREAGAPAVLVSVFDDLPDPGPWTVAVLADGNIGIGGDPVRLLRRLRQLLTPKGRILVEVEGPGVGLVLQRVRLEDSDGRTGSWFPWARLGMDAVHQVSSQVDLTVTEAWSEIDGTVDVDTDRRWFVALQAA